MEAFDAYCFGTSGWMAIQAVPLLLTPKLLVSLLATDPRPTTDVEAYLSRCLAMTLLAVAVLSLLLTNALPLATRPGEDSNGKSGGPSIYVMPTVVVTTTYHAASAFYIYMQLAADRGSFAFYAGLTGSTALFCFGVWILVFGADKGRTSKSTGADKRTSNFPLPNDKAAKSIKKEEKEKKRKSVTRNGSSRGLFG